MDYINMHDSMYNNCDINPERPKWPLFVSNTEEGSLDKMMDYSIDIMERYFIPPFEKIKDIRTCVEFLREYDSYKLAVYPPQELYRFNEGLINLMAYDNVEVFADYKEEAFKNSCKNLLDDIKKGKCGYTQVEFENYKIHRKKRINEDIEIFNQLMNNSIYYDEAVKEMARRKKANSELLRNVGFNI